MNYLFAAVVLCCTIAPSFAGHINATPCKGKTQRATLNYVDISGCSGSECRLRRGQYINLTASFIPDVKVTKSVAKAFATQVGVTLPYKLPNKDACKNMKCPLKAGNTAIYTITVEVYNAVLPGEGTVKGILEFNGRPGICFIFKVYVEG